MRDAEIDSLQPAKRDIIVITDPTKGKALKEAGKLKLQVRWEGITLQEAVDHLNMRVYESPDENLQLRIVLASTVDPETPVPPLRIRDVPMPVLIHHLAILTKTRVRSGERDIVIGK